MFCLLGSSCHCPHLGATVTATLQTRVFLERKAGHVFKSKGFGVTPGAPSQQTRSCRATGRTEAQAGHPAQAQRRRRQVRKPELPQMNIPHQNSATARKDVAPHAAWGPRGGGHFPPQNQREARPWAKHCPPSSPVLGGGGVAWTRWVPESCPVVKTWDCFMLP